MTDLSNSELAQGPLDDLRDVDAPITRADLNELLTAMARERASDQLRMQAMESELRQNTSITAEVREILAFGRNGLRVLGAIGTAAQWIGKIAAAAAALYAAAQLFRGGPPK